MRAAQDGRVLAIGSDRGATRAGQRNTGEARDRAKGPAASARSRTILEG